MKDFRKKLFNHRLTQIYADKHGILFCHRGHREHRDFFRNGFIRLRRTRDFRKKLFNHRLTQINTDFVLATESAETTEKR